MDHTQFFNDRIKEIDGLYGDLVFGHEDVTMELNDEAQVLYVMACSHIQQARNAMKLAQIREKQ